MNPLDAFQQFVTAINEHDVKHLQALMTGDHRFVDSLGNQVETAASMAAGWTGYFKMCPDYWIRVDHVAAAENVVLAAGAAGGTIHGTEWKIPAAWQAVVRDGKIAEWRVFADNKPVYEILAAGSKAT